MYHAVTLPPPSCLPSGVSVLRTQLKKMAACSISLENSLFALMWGAYTQSFERVLAQWEAGNFDQIRPADAQSFIGGLWQTVNCVRDS